MYVAVGVQNHQLEVRNTETGQTRWIMLPDGDDMPYRVEGDEVILTMRSGQIRIQNIETGQTRTM